MDILELLKNTSWATISGLFIYFVLKPLIELVVLKLQGLSNNNQLDKLDKKVNNEIVHDIIRIDNEINELWKEVRKIQQDISEIKTTLKIKSIL